jgi:hypothetical protein
MQQAGDTTFSSPDKPTQTKTQRSLRKIFLNHQGIVQMVLEYAYYPPF